LFHTDRWTERHDEQIVAFRNFEHAPKTGGTDSAGSGQKLMLESFFEHCDEFFYILLTVYIDITSGW